MRSEVMVTVDLSNTKDIRARSDEIPVPEWAVTCDIHPEAGGWGTTPAAVVEVFDLAGNEGVPRSLVHGSTPGPVKFSSNTPERRIDVRASSVLIFETTTAGSSGLVDIGARFRVVFQSLQA